MKKGFYILFLLCLHLSCVNRPKSKVEAKISEYSEDLSIFLPSYPVEVAIPNNPKPADTKPPALIENQNKEVNAVLEKIKENNKKQLADSKGYRIQVYIGNNKTDFDAAKSFLFRNFADFEVYESYSQPTYRLKTGDFINILEVNSVLEEIKARYPAARIVNEKINIKKALE